MPRLPAVEPLGGHTMTDVELIKLLLPHWYATRAWAEALLVQAFELEKASDVLLPQHRGRHDTPGSQWTYRTHGVGVEITCEGNRGGIDFDFDEPALDPWKLRDFALKQLNAKCLPTVYNGLVTDPQRFEKAAEAVCSGSEGSKPGWTRSPMIAVQTIVRTSAQHV